jgi:hypothetical protein
MMVINKTGLLLLAILLLTGCATAPQPHHTENLARIFEQYPDWYQDAKKSEQKWGVPVATQMAIINQESSFSARAKPPRKKLLWIIPWKRPSSAYGYSQALNGTWSDYCCNIGKNAKRHEFAAATDFIGWYGSRANKKAGIQLNDTYRLYLAYHEGIGGFQSRSYWKKPWLIKVAQKVSTRADVYQKQLESYEVKYRS